MNFMYFFVIILIILLLGGGTIGHSRGWFGGNNSAGGLGNSNVGPGQTGPGVTFGGPPPINGTNQSRFSSNPIMLIVILLVVVFVLFWVFGSGNGMVLR